MKLKLLTLIAVLFTTGSLVAQDLEELLKRDFDAERRTIIAESIRIPDGLETEFWKIYSDMEQEMDLLTDKRIVNLKRFANNYENITDDIADDLGLPVRTGERRQWSDHEAFANRGVPVAWVHWRFDSDYHSASDVPDNIDPDLLVKTTTVMLRSLLEIE